MFVSATCYWALGAWQYQITVRHETHEGHVWLQRASGTFEAQLGGNERAVLRSLGAALLRAAAEPG